MSTPQDQSSSQKEPLDKQVEHLLAEARMVLPGVQALFGFQLVAVFNQRFAQALGPGEQRVHLVALGLTALATALLMTPAAYHRQVEPGRVSLSLVRVGSRCLSAAMVPLALGLSVDFYLIARIVLGSTTASAAAALVVAGAFFGLWYVMPRAARAARRRAG